MLFKSTNKYHAVALQVCILKANIFFFNCMLFWAAGCHSISCPGLNHIRITYATHPMAFECYGTRGHVHIDFITVYGISVLSLFFVIVDILLCLVYTLHFVLGIMYRKLYATCSIQCYLHFEASAEGPRCISHGSGGHISTPLRASVQKCLMQPFFLLAASSSKSWRSMSSCPRMWDTASLPG